MTHGDYFWNCWLHHFARRPLRIEKKIQYVPHGIIGVQDRNEEHNVVLVRDRPKPMTTKKTVSIGHPTI